MLKSIHLKNFKSYREAELPLAPLTVLIGANASGKSNAIEAMRMLSWLAQGRKLSDIRYSIQNGDQLVRGKIDDLVYCRETSFELGCRSAEPTYDRLSIEIARRDDELHVSREEITCDTYDYDLPLYSLDHPSIGKGNDVSVSYNNFAKGRNKPFLTCSDQSAIFTQLTSPATFDAKHKESQKKIPPVAKQYEAWLAAMLFLDPVPAKMREYSSPVDKKILGDGSNLSGILFQLWGDESQRETSWYKENRKNILQFIRSLPEQEIDTVEFYKEPRGSVMVRLTETFGGIKKEYDASLLSDGTLRVLAIAAAMLSADENSLVIIEEIDNGVHPSRARHLLERIQTVAKRRNLRVLLSTHNPALLDALPDTAVPDVVFCYRDPGNGSSRLVRLQDVPDYPELIAQGSLGTLVTTGTLERFAKHPSNPEEKKAKALAWLASLRAGDEK